ncbi:MAG: serine/threonine protein kinase [Magnetococcales bacterium]|nr:serine/threonine protein kinase [Magnetococcales bacterium]HIJ84077.1 SUMF1/EgtB/PvdO family nonheme iron enzyme [Magnetococcales bacterium]
MSSTQFTDALPAGSKILWFEIQKVLGKGGFGITYLGRDTNQDQLVAIKEYLPTTFASRTEDRQVHPNSPASKDKFEWGLKRFLKEAQTLARFRHPAIVRVVSFFRDSNTAYMVMEYVQGEGLDVLLKRKKTLTEEEVRKILPPLLDGLEVLHNANFIHRDLKPPNILIRHDGSPVILDFGAARQSVGDDMTSLLSLGYSPFEQYDSSGERQGPWSDIYAMGGVIYRSISGRKPADAAMRIAARLRNDGDPMKAAVEVGKGRYHPAFLGAVDKALEVLETDRPQSVKEWRKMLGIDPMQPQMGVAKKVINRGTVATTDANPQEVKRKKSSWRSFIASINEFSTQGTSLPEISPPRNDQPESSEPTQQKITEKRTLPSDQKQAAPIAAVAVPAPALKKTEASKILLESLTKTEFIKIPAGTFQMGSNTSEKGRKEDEGPIHSVILDGFWLGKTPVTWQTWNRVMGDYPKGIFNPDTALHPCERVSWNMVQKFLERLNKHAKGNKIFRLPTEAEWEYAVRAGTQTVFPFPGGKDELEKHAWIKSNSEEKTHPVGSKLPNPWGLFDMMGNVWEWTADGYDANHYHSSAEKNPKGPDSGDLKSLRGGCWRSQTRECRCANRMSISGKHVSNMVGFRLVLQKPSEDTQ